MSLKIAVITSTTRPTSVGRKVADWTLKNLPKDKSVSYELIDVKEENLPFLDEPQSPKSGHYELESSKAWSKKIDSYDGYIWVVAEYNHGYTAPLKNAIDSLYHEWSKKPVAFVGYGGVGAARATEQLTQVAAELQMMPLSSTGANVRILEPWYAVDDKGDVKQEYVHGSFADLVSHLKWWGEVLKSARGK